MTNPEKKVQYLRSFTSVMMVVIFLVFGFCPLRNAICSLVNPVPKKTAQKAPEHAKIIAHDDCIAMAVNKIIPFHEHASGENLLIFVAVLLITFFVSNGPKTKFNFCYSKIAATRTIPLYLRNCMLLI